MAFSQHRFWGFRSSGTWRRLTGQMALKFKHTTFLQKTRNHSSCSTAQHIEDGWRRFAFLHYNCARRMTQICVFNTRSFSLHNTLNYTIHGACLWMVLLTDVYRNLTSLWIKPRERAFKQFKSPVLNVLISQMTWISKMHHAGTTNEDNQEI